jgi:putative ABC transport system ATP-binding protein
VVPTPAPPLVQHNAAGDPAASAAGNYPGGVPPAAGARVAQPNTPLASSAAGTSVPAAGTRAPTPPHQTPARGPGYTPPMPQPKPQPSHTGPGYQPPSPAKPTPQTAGPGYQPAPQVQHPQPPPAGPGYQAPVTPHQLPPAQGIGYQMPPGYAPAGMQPRPGVMRPTIAVRNLHHTFPGGTFRLSIPSLDIMPGELTYIGGASGSGKSTLIKFLALETVPDSGDIYILDRLIRMLPAKDLDDLRGGGLTYIPQGHLGLTDNTAIQNIQRVLYDYDGVPWTQAEHLAQQALQMVGLDPQNHKQKIKLLSGGQQARVAIAKVFARGRPLCLADEILPALDDKSRHDVLRLLQQLARGGFTVVLIAHQPELKSYFHRVIEMQAGQIIGDQRQTPKPL